MKHLTSSLNVTLTLRAPIYSTNMGMKPATRARISAIIPIAGFPNGTQQIKKWIAAPELVNFEILLVIDSDSANTIRQVQQIAEEIRRISSVSILKSKHRNPGGARNLGLSHAKGEWVTFWDCDDIPIPSKFLEMINKADIINADIALGGFSVKSGSSCRYIINCEKKQSKILEQVAVNPGLWRFAFKSEIVMTTNFRELKMAEDQIFLAEALMTSKKIDFLSEIVYEYWQYPSGQLTKDKSAMKDLEAAANYFIQMYSKTRCKPILIVTIRILFTAFRKGTIQLREEAIRKFAFQFVAKPKDLWLLIKSIFSIWKYR